MHSAASQIAPANSKLDLVPSILRYIYSCFSTLSLLVPELLMMHIVAYLVVCHLHHPTQMPQFCGANQEQMAVHNGVDFNLSVDRIYYGLATICEKCMNMCAVYDTLPATPSATLECIISIVHFIKHMQFFFSVISMNMC